jgi:hypothetical protein
MACGPSVAQELAALSRKRWPTALRQCGLARAGGLCHRPTATNPRSNPSSSTRVTLPRRTHPFPLGATLPDVYQL